jgi:general secretion pathway protein F
LPRYFLYGTFNEIYEPPDKAIWNSIMPVYEYKALSPRGKKVTGILDADSPRAARMKLRADGYYPVEIQFGGKEDVSTSTSIRIPSVLSVFRRVRHQERASLTRQLATLVGAGIPLVGALDTIIQQTSHRSLRKALVDIRESVMGGNPLAAALSNHRWLFSDLYVNMVHAGESSGALDAVLNRLADLLERSAKLKNRVQSALFYPITMMAIGGVVLIFLLTHVVPIVTKLFTEAKQQLPLPTTILIVSSNFLIQWWPVLIGGVVALAILLHRFLATPAGRMYWDRLKLRLPLVGSLYRKLIIARFSRTLGTLLEGGLPLTSSLAIVQHVINNAFMARYVESAIQDVNEGEELTVPLGKSRAFPPMVIQMLAAGERSGAMEEMLLKIAEAYEDEVDNTISALTSLLEPFLILAMGLLVGFIVLSILLPILQMSRLLG